MFWVRSVWYLWKIFNASCFQERVPNQLDVLGFDFFLFLCLNDPYVFGNNALYYPSPSPVSETVLFDIVFRKPLKTIFVIISLSLSSNFGSRTLLRAFSLFNMGLQLNNFLLLRPLFRNQLVKVKNIPRFDLKISFLWSLTRTTAILTKQNIDLYALEISQIDHLAIIVLYLPNAGQLIHFWHGLNSKS